MEVLRKDLDETFYFRLDSELKVWSSVEEEREQEENAEIKKRTDSSHFEQQHEIFSVHNGLDRLLIFLLGGENSDLGTNLLMTFD